MPGLIFRSAASVSSLWVKRATWRQILLMLCLVCAADQSMAQATDSSQIETNSVTGSEVDAILSGIDITRRVLGGADSTPDDWPSVVALVTPGIATLKDRFFCGGTIVADRWVMTAAHCLFDSFGRLEIAADIRVVAGVHDLVDDEGLEEVNVTNIIVHPGYDNASEEQTNDIALLELAIALDAPVGELFVGDTEDYTGTIGYIVGWGATRYINERDADYPTTQQEAPVPLVSLATCNAEISYNGLVAETQLCAGYAEGEIDTCAGDSGGPLYIVEDGRVIQVGITSFGNGCGLENFYGIYTNVSHYISWLGNYITVPEQTLNTGSSSGAMNPLYLLLLVGASLFRKRVCIASRLTDSFLWRSCKGRNKLLVAPIALLLSACTVSSIGAQSGTNTPDQPLQENNSMSEVHTLMFNDDSLRSGVDGLQLGATHDDLVSSLMKAHWQKLVCESGKTALRAKGRLFQTEHCQAKAEGAVELHGHQVRQLDLFLLDQQLVRMDVVLASSTAADGSTQLTTLLEDSYQQAGVEKSDKEHGSVWLWQRQDDQIRLYPERRLQFVDGRLESSLPALYEFNPPFNFD